jgi:glyoxylase-like metal-dependent hydrolase (beta-lactamase superfamily II)
VQIFSLEGNTQRLDGGAMFGNCPRDVWARWSPPDDHNRINLACRSMLVREDSGRHVLLETGIGAFFEPKMRERFGVQEPEHVLLRSLAELGLAPADIDVIVLSHLHFDHAGGLLSAWSPDHAPQLVFPSARYLVSAAAWQRALHPHPRDRASFIPVLQDMLQATGRLEAIDGPHSDTLGPAYRFHLSNGHTPGLMLTRVEGGDPGPITFLGDLVPGVPWVHLPITMGYDRFPELLIDEKEALLANIVAEHGWAFYTHDPAVAASRVLRSPEGRFSAAEPRPHLRA